MTNSSSSLNKTACTIRLNDIHFTLKLTLTNSIHHITLHRIQNP
uniref:Uncharacterized protein n=1 Tax=Arundo donax TaxID=35708 RepID=A0A0A9A3J5_ARUDO